MIHYELIILYSAGFTPKDCVRYFGFSRASAYRFYRIYRFARERAKAIILHRNSVSPGRELKRKKLGPLRKKKGRPAAEKKPVLILNKETGEYEKIFL